MCSLLERNLNWMADNSSKESGPYTNDDPIREYLLLITSVITQPPRQIRWLFYVRQQL